MENTEARQRFYYDGKLTKTSKGSLERLRRWLDNMEREWSKNLMPQVAPGEFDPNKGSEVTRVSIDELHVVTTGGHVLRTVNILAKENR